MYSDNRIRGENGIFLKGELKLHFSPFFRKKGDSLIHTFLKTTPKITITKRPKIGLKIKQLQYGAN